MTKRRVTPISTHATGILLAVALIIFTATVSVVTDYGALAASVVRQSSKKARVLPPRAAELTGVWEISKIKEYNEKQQALIERPPREEEKKYVVFQGDQTCLSRAVIAREAICHSNNEPYTTSGEAIRSEAWEGFLGAGRLVGGRLEFGFGGEVKGDGKKGGGSNQYLFKKIKLYNEPLHPINTAYRETPADRARERRFKTAAQALLTKVPAWQQELEAAGSTFGYTLDESVLEKDSWSGFESIYYEVLRWARRAQKELSEGNYRSAHHFAVTSHLSYLEARQSIPQYQIIYKAQQAIEAQQATQRAAQESGEDLDIDETPPARAPHVPRPLTAMDQELQGAWQMDKLSVLEGGTWRDLAPSEILRGMNNYLIFIGDRFCTQGMVTYTSEELVCTNNFIPYTLKGMGVRNDIIMGDKDEMKLVGQSIDYLIQSEYTTSRSVYTKRPGLTLPTP